MSITQVRMAKNVNNPLGNVLEEKEVEDIDQDEVPLPQAPHRGSQDNANNNNPIPNPPLPPPRVAPRVLPNQRYASAIFPPRIWVGNFQITNARLTLLEQKGYFTGSSDQNAYKHLKGFVDT